MKRGLILYITYRISAGNFRDLYEIITKSGEVLTKNGQHLDNVLETLDLQQHSLGILAVLCAKFSLSNPNGGNNPDANKLLFNQVQEFIVGCNGEQVRFAPDTCKYKFFCYNLYAIIMLLLLMKYILQMQNCVINLHRVWWNQKCHCVELNCCVAQYAKYSSLTVS
jgi:hypothetical protein